MQQAKESASRDTPDPPVEILSEQRHGYPRAAPLAWDNIAFHVVGASALLAVLGWASGWLWTALRTADLLRALFGIVAGTALGLFVADLLSGAAHWAFDTWFDEHHSILHRMVLVVREHHIAPQAMFGYPFYNDTGQLSWLAIAIAAPVLAPIVLWAPASAFGIALVWACIVQSLCFVFMLEFHKLGHRAPARGIIGVMQRYHLLLQPRHHWKHHSGAYNTHYCLINGWADPIMDRLAGWRWIERIVARVTGATPRANDDLWLETWLPPRRKALWQKARPRPSKERS